MNVLRYLPVIISIFLLAAHFYRAGIMVLMAGMFGSLFLLFIRRRWAASVMQVILVVGGVEWIRTLLMLVNERQAMGRPWARLAIILGVVAVVTISSSLVFRYTSLRERYTPGPELKEKY